MNNTLNVLFDFDDLLIEPITISNITSRTQVNCRNLFGNLPLLTAPMDTVIDKNNFHLFKKEGITPVLPRTLNPDSDWVDTGIFLSYSLDDFEKIFLNGTVYVPEGSKILALIDVANGHMINLLEISKKAKIKYGESMCLMVGNVANPKTFEEYCKIGVDIIRVGIGNGGGCLTTVQTGVGYPMASLIKECYDVKKRNGYVSKIVADGGFKKFSDIIKALGLGADYVMLGSILNKCLESAGETRKRKDSTLGGWEPINQYSEESKQMFNVDIELTKVFRGMSTKDVQRSWGKEDLTTSEGVVRTHKVEYTLDGWVKNFEDYLKSAMSYTGKKELHQFIGGVRFNMISQNSFKRFDK
jgi:IMP dehydrogenase/GMP reductase